jgi:dolichol kinase
MAGAGSNLVVMVACYLYVVFIILFSGAVRRAGFISPMTSRKFLHAMIGNLPLIMPYFTEAIYPFLVASPFIVVTFLATPYSPLQNFLDRLGNLGELTEVGHSTGPLMYAISYTLLAYLYGASPYIVAAGIFPMAYGDSSAALIGMKYGSIRFSVFEEKSVQGSMGMFVGSFVSLTLGMAYFSGIYGFTLGSQLVPIIAVSLVTTIVEAVCPRGLDNIFVPIMGALTFIATGGGV